ncbi:MAG: hypothetical protein GJ680_18100 [Alteromonadaceae bacterium]|nr:hypothetical protein [Alteromonadaceae bacterium]
MPINSLCTLMQADKKTASRLLQLSTPENWQSQQHNRPIPVLISKIAYEVWAPYRLDRCLGLYREQKRVEPVSLVYLQVGKNRIYDVSDGNHRCGAKKTLGKRYISAKVAGGYQIDLRQFALYDKKLWSVENDYLALVLDLSEDDFEFYKALGITLIR